MSRLVNGKSEPGFQSRKELGHLKNKGSFIPRLSLLSINIKKGRKEGRKIKKDSQD